MEQMYNELGIPQCVVQRGEEILEELEQQFKTIDDISEYNQLKILKAFQNNKVSYECLQGSSGYGYNDIGRDTLEKVYADIFHTQSALVRPQITCGTHALSLALSGILRPNDELLSPVGKPYDTLEEVIGIRKTLGSLSEFHITYRQVDLLEDGSFDFKRVQSSICEKTKMITIQKSKGYATRPTLSNQRIKELISFIRSVKEDIIILVDNCYGEFIEKTEPSDVGANLVVGSLIKNPGGGLAPTGGYICGDETCISQIATRLNAPGLGREVGASLSVLRDFYQGLFLAPSVCASALKGALFAAKYYESLGFAVYPSANEERFDIIQAITLEKKERLLAFCEGIQKAAPIDSHVTPIPWDMPGYEDPVIMAAGAFISGASIELSADGPLREPYNVYFQGGLTFPHVKYGILNTISYLLSRNLITLS